MLKPRNRKLQEGCPSGQREQAVNLPAQVYVGSNPTPSTAPRARYWRSDKRRPEWKNAGLSALATNSAGVAQLVERQPSKLNVAGSNPVSRSSRSAHLAQLVEHVLGKDEVTSSILVVGSKS